MPKVSVLMTNYNAGKFIGDAIESILRQTFRDFEFIILDDGSTDNSWDIIQKYAQDDARIRCYKNEKNLGVACSRNKLIDYGQGELIAWADADDTSEEERLMIQRDFLQKNTHCGGVGSWMNIHDKEGRSIGIKRVPSDDKGIRKSFFIRSPLNQPTLMIRKECCEKIGYYNQHMEPADDLDFLARTLEYSTLANIPKVLVHYRIHGDNLSLRKQKQMIKNTLLIRRKMHNRGHRMGITGKGMYAITWIMQYLPSAFVLSIFNHGITVFPGKK